MLVSKKEDFADNFEKWEKKTQVYEVLREIL